MTQTAMKRILRLLCLPALLALAACTGIPRGLKPVTDFDVERYLGTWYEIARLDHRFERNLSHVSAVYARGTDGGITVLNRGYDAAAKKWKQISGRARFKDHDRNGSLEVSFFGPFYGGYHVIVLDRNAYGYAMVAGPSRSYLWILARRPYLDGKTLADLVATARRWGFDTDRLIYVRHDPLEKRDGQP